MDLKGVDFHAPCATNVKRRTYDAERMIFSSIGRDCLEVGDKKVRRTFMQLVVGCKGCDMEAVCSFAPAWDKVMVWTGPVRTFLPH